MTILVGDIGGTKTNLALWENGNLTHLLSFPSKNYANLNPIVLEYLNTIKRPIDAACYAVAGPVVENVSKITNLPWVISLKELIQDTKILKSFIINDLEAGAWAVNALPEKSLYLLHAGEGQKKGNKALVSPGTGLGEAGLIWQGQTYIPFASEGGHSDFGGESELQLELSSYFFKKIGHLSYDRLLSGPGFLNLYGFLVETEKYLPPQWLLEEMKVKDPSAVITENALNGKSELCVAVVDLYLEILGQEASNVALKFMAIGGIYLGGGIPPKILPLLKSRPSFLKGYKNKGRFATFVDKIPVHVILDEKANLVGAAKFVFGQG